jgi:hypothetical protein
MTAGNHSNNLKIEKIKIFHAALENDPETRLKGVRGQKET